MLPPTPSTTIFRFSQQRLCLLVGTVSGFVAYLTGLLIQAQPKQSFYDYFIMGAVPLAVVLIITTGILLRVRQKPENTAYPLDSVGILVLLTLLALFYSGFFLFLYWATPCLLMLHPHIGWLSTIQDGLALVALYAALSSYLALLLSLQLVFPNLWRITPDTKR